MRDLTTSELSFVSGGDGTITRTAPDGSSTTITCPEGTRPSMSWGSGEVVIGTRIIRGGKVQGKGAHAGCEPISSDDDGSDDDDKSSDESQ
ncbi:MAG: hypothetical protein PVI56_12350 [Gammaproteobacteria bacterium]|jgi:hypothetical protein